MLKLRPYQEEMLIRIKLEFSKGNRRIVLQLPTGGGKTAMFSSISKMAIDKGNSVLIITDRKELLKQSGNTLELFGVTPFLLTSKTRALQPGSLCVAMVETIKARLHKSDYVSFIGAFKIIIIDECHKNAFNRIFEHLQPEQYVIGATATPYRDGKMRELKQDYDVIVEGVQISKLQELGFLSNVTSYGVPVDLSSVKITSGEFNPADLEIMYSKCELFSGAVMNYQKHTPGTKALAFSPTVATSELLCAEFVKAGILATHLDAETPSAERDRILAEFAAGRITVLCNVGILTTGYDCPDIETIILYRATKSLPLFLQMCGRGSRVAQGKSGFSILDFGNNIKRHNFWQADRIWSLDNPKKKKRNKEEQDYYPIKYCPECEAMIQASLKICPECGYEYPVNEKERMMAELQVLSPTQINRLAEFASIRELEEIREAKGYKVGWVLHKLKDIDQFKQYEKLKNYKRGWHIYAWRTMQNGK